MSLQGLEYDLLRSQYPTHHLDFPSDGQLTEMFGRITAEEVDDSEEILQWFSEHGPAIIVELLDLRHPQREEQREE